MCATYRFFTEKDYRESAFIIDSLIQKYGQAQADSIISSDFFPKMKAPVVLKHEDVALMTWGYPMKDTKSVVFNARSESVMEKPFFRNSVINGRCLIPSYGFYEWKKDGSAKKKALIKPDGKDFFYMAGLYNVFTTSENVKYTAFTIITTEANNQMSEIHNRMPVLLTDGREQDWLYEDKPNGIFIKEILMPFPKKLTIQYI